MIIFPCSFSNGNSPKVFMNMGLIRNMCDCFSQPDSILESRNKACQRGRKNSGTHGAHSKLRELGVLSWLCTCPSFFFEYKRYT